MGFFRFFFGTPRRFLVSLIAITIASGVEHFAPGTITTALVAGGSAVLTAVLRLLDQFLGPLAGAVLPLILVGIGFRIMLRGFGGKKKRKK